MAWDKSKPAGALPISQGGSDIRANNDHIEEGNAREHTFPGTAGPGGTSMRPLPGAARIFYQSAAPTLISAGAALDSGRLWAGDTDKLLRLYTGSVWALLAGAAYQAAAPSGPSAGSLWTDSDDDLSYVYNGSIWVKQKAAWRHNPVPSFDTSATGGAFTNAGFSTLSGLTVSAAIPSTGTWTLLILGAIQLATNVVTHEGSAIRAAISDGSTTIYSDVLSQSYDNSETKVQPVLWAMTATNGKTYTVTIEGSATTPNPTYFNSGGSSALLLLPFYRGD